MDWVKCKCEVTRSGCLTLVCMTGRLIVAGGGVIGIVIVSVDSYEVYDVFDTKEESDRVD